MHDDKDLHLTCECHSHELHIERDPLSNKDDYMWYGSFWMRGYSEKNWKWKWRVLWEVLKTGKPYGDEIVLSKEQMQELLVYCQEQLKFTEKK